MPLDTLQTAHLLLVDDEGPLLEGLADLLRDHGTQVDTASNGREAIDALEKTPYTLVATDIRMPDVSGIELLQHVKEHYPDTEVILITGYASTSSAIEALRLGAYDYIEKPFEMLEFLQTIVNGLEHAKLKLKNKTLIGELEAYQRRLERLVESKNAETQNANRRLQQLDYLVTRMTESIETLHRANDAIRDTAVECKKNGRGYSGPVNSLIRTCIRQCADITDHLDDLETNLKTQKPSIDQPQPIIAPGKRPIYIPEPEALSASDIETIYTRLYTYLEEFMNAQQTGDRLDVEPAFTAMEHITATPDALNILYRRALQTPETGEDYGFASSVIQHSVNVAIYTLKIGEGFKYTQDQCIELGVAALLHDVGMAHLPTDFFSKTDLSNQDRKLLHQHPIRAQTIMKSLGIGYSWLADIVHQEHEREDGSGYPQGLTGDQIHPYAKVISLADTYAGLTRARPKRPGYLPFEAVQEITRNHRVKFSPQLLRILLSGLSTFPLETLVRLNSGAVGKVIETNEAYPMRPSVQVVKNPQGEPVLDKRIIHLREHSILYITDVVYQNDA